MSLVARTAYGARAAATVGLHAAHWWWARRQSAPFEAPEGPAFRSPHKVPDRAAVARAFAAAFEADLAAIEQGLYPAPPPPDLATLASQARAYRADVASIDHRRQARAGTEVRDDPATAGYPAYFRQNFHWQTGGWFTQESAQLYDFQVETLFTGSAAPMRRATALALLAESLTGIDQRQVRCLDLACGTGSFTADVARAFPRMKLQALDLSPAYAAHARGALARYAVPVMTGLAEALPFEDASLDRVVCVYLFHELPPKVRAAVMREVARVLAPGGIFVLADALRTGDNPDLDRMLDAFPFGFHEPFFTSWLTTDLDALAHDAGLLPGPSRQAFLTRAVAYTKPR